MIGMFEDECMPALIGCLLLSVGCRIVLAVKELVAKSKINCEVVALHLRSCPSLRKPIAKL